MIIITGAAGFIGSNLTGWLNKMGYTNLVLADDFSNPSKERNLSGKSYAVKIDRNHLTEWLEDHHGQVGFVFHLGARTDTAEFNKAIFDRLNYNYSRLVWEACTRFGIPLIYASSAATYGNGEHGYADDHSLIDRLVPLNPYGESKNEFDRWVLAQIHTPPFWAGFKFFNVYGPNEYHKGRMASVVLHAYNQIKETGKMKLFRSHKPGVPDGGQKRDFIHVHDVLKVLIHFSESKPSSGIYNLGTGQARSFLELTRETFAAMGKVPVVEYIDTPADIREKYQYFTEARMDKLRNAGYTSSFMTLEEGISDYVTYYLMNDRVF